jgi:hypothetical protein
LYGLKRRPCRLDADQVHRDCAESARQFSSPPPTATPEAHGFRFFADCEKPLGSLGTNIDEFRKPRTKQ